MSKQADALSRSHWNQLFSTYICCKQGGNQSSKLSSPVIFYCPGNHLNMGKSTFEICFSDGEYGSSNAMLRDYRRYLCTLENKDSYWKKNRRVLKTPVITMLWRFERKWENDGLKRVMWKLKTTTGVYVIQSQVKLKKSKQK